MNTIQKFWEKIKPLLSGDVMIVIVIILVGISSFGLGRLSVIEQKKEPVRIEFNQSASAAVGIETANDTIPAGQAGALLGDGGKFVASKNSTVYHFPWCSGAKRIAEKNKIWFDSKEDAEKAGYRPAKNCKGL